MLHRRALGLSVGFSVVLLLTACPNYLFEQKLPQKVKEMQMTMAAGTPVPADIMFVVDNSASMDNKQENLRKNFDNFISQIAGVGDYQIGVVTTDLTSTGQEKGGVSMETYETVSPFDLTMLDVSQCAPVPIEHGCFRGPDASKRIIKSSALMKDDQITAFKANATVGSCGSGIEQGLKAISAALANTRSGSCNDGFLRPNANLVIIILSDENDTDDTPIEQYVNDIMQFKDYGKVRVAAIVASENGAASSCNAMQGAMCGQQVCMNPPPIGSHGNCMNDSQCSNGETCQTNPGGGRWCETKSRQFFDTKYCGWCTFFNAPDCCYAIPFANPDVGMPGRYIDWAKQMEAKIVDKAPGLQVNHCDVHAAAPACFVDTICQDSFADTLARIARELVLTNQYNLSPPTNYPPGVKVHIFGGMRFGDAGVDLTNCAGVTDPTKCDFNVSSDGATLTITGPNTPKEGETVQIYYIVPSP